MLQLYQQLCEKWQRERLSSPNLSRDLKVIIKETLGGEQQEVEVLQYHKGRRTYCSFCDYRKRNRMTETYCRCGKVISGEHKEMHVLIVFKHVTLIHDSFTFCF